MFDYFKYLYTYKKKTKKDIKHLYGFVILISILNTKITDIPLVYDEFKSALDYPNEIKEFIEYLENEL